MISNAAISTSRLACTFGALAVLAFFSSQCSSATEPTGSTAEELLCNQDDCPGLPPPREPCGLLDYACCTGGKCTDGSVCGVDNTCATTCGARGYECCYGNTCANGVACTSTGTCGPCGGAGQVCCSGVGCNSGLTCQSGTCNAPPVKCGDVGQGCCNGTTCNSGLQCKGGTCEPPCGYQGGPCCATTGWNQCLVSTLACDPTFHQCEPCGGLGQVCCETLFGKSCNFNYTCGNNDYCTFP